MSRKRFTINPDIVSVCKTYRCSGKGNSRQLRSISPFSNKCEDKSLEENSIDTNCLKSIIS